MESSQSLILVTGATGYIGGQLVPKLIEAGHRVRILVRDTKRLRGAPWLPQVEVYEGDVLKADTLAPALKSVNTAYYLVHSLGSGRDFEEQDILAPRTFSTTAKAEGVKRIVYLGGLGDPDSELSPHLRSRHTTGQALRDSGVPVIEFRAGVIVGSGSASFEIVRYLTERLPVMICPRWVYTRAQPISIKDIMNYLVGALEIRLEGSQVVEVGGADILSYGEMMLVYARLRGLRRWIIPVPVLTPHLSSYWVHRVTPIQASIAKPLIEGLRNEVIVKNPSAKKLFPTIKPTGYVAAIKSIVQDLEAGRVKDLWVGFSANDDSRGSVIKSSIKEGVISQRWSRKVPASADATFQVISEFGGEHGYYYANWAWRLRGLADRLLGGVGNRLRSPQKTVLEQGDPLGFWCVDVIEPGRLLRLKAEMKIPGSAWLQFLVRPISDHSAIVYQTVAFAPKGISGLVYWYALYPAHAVIFRGLFTAITALAEDRYSSPTNVK
ncbi:MAG: SDR family oxidoreductase [SAR202 cluster bacterium]|nr:SDR family oxidoreductase [SAR202 cluster bacterium]